MTIQAPAKVNLVLRVLAKRPDGFHEIETLMAPVSLADELDITVSGGTGVDFRCDAPDIPSDPGNLAWRAVDVFAKETGLRFHTTVLLKKNIPHGAGLGGGSSDAAAVLKALDQLLGTQLGWRRLEEMASTMGSDIPFFIRGVPAWCRGRGELMEEAPALPGTKLLLLKPPFPVSTGWAYQAWGAGQQNSGDCSGRDAERAEKNGFRVQALNGIALQNDLEEPVFQKHLLLPVMKSWLLAQEEVSAAMMSGSGSTVFAVLRGDAGSLAGRAIEQFGRHLWVCETSL